MAKASAIAQSIVPDSTILRRSSSSRVSLGWTVKPSGGVETRWAISCSCSTDTGDGTTSLGGSWIGSKAAGTMSLVAANASSSSPVLLEQRLPLLDRQLPGVDQPLHVELAHRAPLLDQPVHQRLGVGRLVALVVPLRR